MFVIRRMKKIALGVGIKNSIHIPELWRRWNQQESVVDFVLEIENVWTSKWMALLITRAENLG